MIDKLNEKNFALGWPRYLVAVTLATAVCAVGPRAPSPESGLDRLLSARRYFELRRILESGGNGSQPEVNYFRGRVANAFNQIPASIDDLTAYLQGPGAGLTETRLKEALATLADDYVKSFQYGKAADVRRKLEPLLRGELQPDIFTEFQSTTLLWEALATFPPQSVTIPGDTEISASGDGGVPVVIAGRTVSLLPDTGSSLSLISRAEADHAGFRWLDVTLDISTSTGERVAARAAVVDEMRLGRIIVRNAVFLVVPEPLLYFPEIKEQRTGLLGFPVLAGLKELAFFKTGSILVRARQRANGPPNFFLEKENPVLEANYQGRRLLFQLDTGAAVSQLYPPFFRVFRDKIQMRGAPVGENIEGVGTHVTVPAYLIQGAHFAIAGRDVVFDRPMPVLTKTTNPSSEVFDGVLGLDILDHFQTMTISYEAMRIVLE